MDEARTPTARTAVLRRPAWAPFDLDRLRALVLERRWTLSVLAVSLLTVGVRARHVLPAGFPLNDGGLFSVMSQDIQRAGYALPSVTTYNAPAGEGLPFAYPPLALYLAALIEDLTPLSMEQVYWLLPLVAASAAVAGVYALARTVMPGRAIPLLAAAAFALAPRSFEWLVMGGGATRAVGLTTALFAIAAYRYALRRDPPSRRAWALALGAATVLSAATLATHLEAAVFLASGLALSSIVRPSRWRAAVALTVAIGAPVLAAPWWGTVLARHGAEPFLAALGHGGDVLSDGAVTRDVLLRVIDPVFTSEPYFSVIGAAGALGAVVAMARGRWLLAAWWALLIVLQMRSFATYTVVPTAILAAYAAVEVVLPALRGAPDLPSGVLARWRPVAVAGAIGALALFGAVEADRGEAVFLRPLSVSDQAAMAWASRETPQGARFLVVPERPWYADREGEWWPALSDRQAVNVPQGTEWVDGEFDQRVHLHDRARDCWDEDVACLEALGAGTVFTHVYLPDDCCQPLLHSIAHDERWVLLYQHGASVAVRLTAWRLWPLE